MDYINITDKAITQFKVILNNSDKNSFRLGILGGGCAGLQYKLELNSNIFENDIIQEQSEIKFYIHPMCLPYIKGITIDYSDALIDGGFKFINPNASSNCGCGTSFGV